MRWRDGVLVVAGLVLSACSTSAGLTPGPEASGPTADLTSTVVASGTPSAGAVASAVPARSSAAATSATAPSAPSVPVPAATAPAPAATSAAATSAPSTTPTGSVDAVLVSTAARSTSCAEAQVRVVSVSDTPLHGQVDLVASWVGTQNGSTDRYTVDELGRPAVSAAFALRPGEATTLTLDACAVTAPPPDSTDAQFDLSRPSTTVSWDTAGR